MRLRDHRDHLRNRPHERDQFARDRRDRHVRMFATRDESSKALAQPDLRLPPEVLNGFRQRVDASLDVLGHLDSLKDFDGTMLFV